MAEKKCSLPEAWRNDELTPEAISHCHDQLLPDLQDLEREVTAAEKSIETYLDALNNYCSSSCQVSSALTKLLGDTPLSKISQQFQHITEQLEHDAHKRSVDISSSVLTNLCEFLSTLPSVKQEIGEYKRSKSRYEKCRETLESFAEKDAAASEGKRFQTAKERFHSADKDFTEQQEQLVQCLSDLESNRIKMVGASLLSMLHTLAQLNNHSSSTFAPVGKYHSVGDYLRDGEIAPQLKKATASWCSIAQRYQGVRDKYLSGADIYNLLEHKKGEDLPLVQKNNLLKHIRNLLEDYKKGVNEVESGPVSIPGGFFRNPVGIRVALKGCCSDLESLAIDGVNLSPTYIEMVDTLRHEIPKTQLAVASVGKQWHQVANFEDSDIVHSRQHCLKDLIEPLAKQFDIPFTKESFDSFTLTVLHEACSKKTILASRIAVQLMYGKTDLVVVKLSPDSSSSRPVHVHCKEKGVNIDVQLTWWIVMDHSLFSTILEEEDNEALFKVNTTYSIVIDYMDYLEEKETRLPSITVEYQASPEFPLKNEDNSVASESCSDVPVAPPRTKHYSRKYAARKKTRELDTLISHSVNKCGVDKKSQSGIDKHQGSAGHLSLASETELSEVINFLSGARPRASPEDGDTESVCSTRALSDSGIESVTNGKLGLAGACRQGNQGGSGDVDEQTKGKKGRRKEKKAASKSESFNKKKKRKRADRKKEKKKAAADDGEQQENETTQQKDEVNSENGVNQKTVDTSCTQAVTKSSESCDKEEVKICESLRSVWEQDTKNPLEAEHNQTNAFSLQVPSLANQTSTMQGSQDSIYYSCWSLPGLVADSDEKQSMIKVSRQETESSAVQNHCWSKGFEQHDSTTQKNIWSPAPQTMETLSRNEPWPPCLKRQDGVDVDENEASLVGESVFSLGLGITGFELFAAAKQASYASSQRSNNSRIDGLDMKSTSSQPSMWTSRGKLTAGQYCERSSSYGEGLHRVLRNESLDRARLQARHSDPFLSKNIQWTPPGVPPMYMKVRYNPSLIAPFPNEEIRGTYRTPEEMRGHVRSSFPSQGSLDRRRTPSQFFVPPRCGST